VDLLRVPAEYRGRISPNGNANFSGQGWTELPAWIGSLTHVTDLNLRANRLSRLPDWIGGLTRLAHLNVSENQLTQLPEAIGNFGELATLDVSDNQLTDLPLKLADLLTWSFQLYVTGNPLREPLPELVARGNPELATYLRSLTDSVIQHEAKLLLVGEGNVGKSSLVAALAGDPFVKDRPTTHGIEISPIPLRHPSLDWDMILRAWDFGGQEVYRVSHQFFFSPRALFLVVWHARHGQERDEVENWLRRINLRVGTAATAMIVATHSEERRADLDYPYLERLFPGMLNGAFAIDSSTGQGVDALRAAISEQASRLPTMGQRWSPRWTAAREAVLALGRTEPQIRYGQFSEICERNGMAGYEIGTLAKLMHDLGLIIYYDEDEGLKDVVVLNPEWLTKAISYVLEDTATATNGGVLDHARLKAIWQGPDDGYPTRYHPYFLRLMEKFDISYRLDNDPTRSLVSQLVPHQRPPLPWSHGSAVPAEVRSLSLKCQLSEPAPGLIPWLIVRHHRASTGNHWRRGVFLRHPVDAYRSEALLELLRDNELALEVRAPSPDLYFNVLRDSIEDLITRRWPGLKYQLFIPCPGFAARGAPCPGQFRLDGLLRVRETSRASDYPCPDCGNLYEISQLLTGFTAPPQPLAAEIKQIHDQVTNIAAGVNGLRGLPAELAGIAATVRRMHQIVSTEVTDCPRLFTFGLWKEKSSWFDSKKLLNEHYQLTLWCEHPGYEHPWAKATYDIYELKPWLVKVAPYARLVFKTLQLAVPVAAAIDLARLPTASRDDTQARLEVMQSIIGDLPTDALQLTDYEVAELGGDSRRLTHAEGQALRAVREILFREDPLRTFGDLRRAASPSGDLLWVCPGHYPEYDPGLPKLPYTRRWR
jgi:internalin A